MKTRLVIDEDSVYEIDEECDRARREGEQKEDKKEERKKEIRKKCNHKTQN